jgi:COP9 signalosome complex subunit 3
MCQPSVAVQVLATAILRIDPTGSMLTTTHIHLAKLAYNTNNIPPALQVIDKSIVFYPGMANHRTPELLCDRSLSPSAYVNKDTGITAGIKSAAILEYDLLCGMMYCSERDWAKAHAAFERVVTFPTRDHGISKIMSEAYKKWALVSLLLNGKLQAPPTYTGAAATKAYNTLGKLYQEIAVIFETDGAGELKTEVEKHTKDWQDDGNTGLIGEVLAAYQEWQILNLQHVYSKLSIAEIRQQTKSAQTGDILGKDEDVESLIQNMVISGTLKGVIEKNDDGTTFLTFLPPSAVLSEGEFAKEITTTAMRLKALQPVFKATNERLGTSKEYIKHLAKEQRRAADKDTNDPTAGFESHVDDEDMMAGITSTAFEA